MSIVAEDVTASGVTLGGPRLDEGMPAVMALRTLQSVISEMIENRSFSVYAQTDMRVLNELSDTLALNPRDDAATKWLRQFAIAWSTRLRGMYPRQFRRLFNLLDVMAGRPAA